MLWVRSVSKMLPSVNSRKIRCSLSLFSVKNAKIVQLLSLTQILTLISRADCSDKSELSNGTLFFKTFGSIKERTQTSAEMSISCQPNGHWAATNHLSGRGLVQPIKKLSSAVGRCAGRGCALIRQLANTVSG